MTESIIMRINDGKPTTSEISKPEKDILEQVYPASDILPYPIHEMKMSNGTIEQEYEIPAEDKAKVLSELYPFEGAISCDDTRFCLHEQKEFKVRDFRVIRTRGRNMLVSPFFQHTGGMVIDWINPCEAENRLTIRKEFSARMK